MCYDIEFTVDKALIKKALHQFMIKRIGWLWITTFFCLWIWFGYVALRYRWGILSNFFAGILILCTLLLMYIYHIRLKQSETFLSKMKEPKVRYRFDHGGITVSSELGESKLNWIVFEEILKFQELWLLIYAKSAYLTIPIKEMSAECQQFIEHHISV
jgi:hypothetical protein